MGNSSRRAASQLIVQRNQFSWCLIPACQRKSLGERQGSEALAANVSIGQDWEHWCLMAQGSLAHLSSGPCSSLEGEHAGGMHMGSFLHSLRRGCEGGEPGQRRAPKRRRRLPLSDISDDGQQRALETKGCFPNV